MKTKKYRLKLNTAYLMEDGTVLVFISRWDDGMKLFERSVGNTPYCSSCAKFIRAVNSMKV